MKFEWNDVKAEQNLKNHGEISFEDAKEVFADQFALDVYDDSHSEADENRFRCLGTTKKGVLIVVYTLRIEETYRIISARRAEKFEEAAYWIERSKYE